MILLFPDNSGCLLPGESKMFHLIIVQVRVLNCVRLLVTHGLWPARLLCPWNFPGKNTEVGCHFLLQGIFPSQGSGTCSWRLLHCRQILYTRATWEAHSSGPHLLAGALTKSYNFHMLPTLFGGAPEVLQDLNAPGSYKGAFFSCPQSISIPRY